MSKVSPETLQRVNEINDSDPDCIICDGGGWVCENHEKLAWEGSSESKGACDCGGAGMPCTCNPLYVHGHTKH